MNKINKLISQIELEISDCYLDAGDGGNNSDEIDYLTETLSDLKTLIQCDLTKEIHTAVDDIRLGNFDLAIKTLQKLI